MSGTSSRTRKVFLALLSFVVLGLATAVRTRADIIQLTSAAQLTPGGTTATYPQPVLSVLASPYVLTAGGNTLSFTETGSFVRLNQGAGWGGNFPPNTPLLYTGNDAGLGSGPINISFSVPLLEFGLLAQNSEEGTGMFTFTMFQEATALGSFNVMADGFASFLGARAFSGQLITRIMISGTSSVPGGNNNFAIGPVTFQAIPEPTTLVLLGTGLAGAAAAGRRQRRQGRRE